MKTLKQAKLSNKLHIKALIEQSLRWKERAREQGFEYLPSFEGPYIYCNKTKRVIASYSSEKFYEICGD
ncbi:hypothetical protein AAFP45_004621 [Salmonella enterica]